MLQTWFHFLRRFPVLSIPVPVPGLGCGVVGIVFARQNVDLGRIASRLLRSLEYRGYDSTGAAILDEQGTITLRKDVGAPSTLVKTLGIESMEGKIMCGQVRWATFGSVTRENAQPHEVKCKKHLFGAHNGNITNTSKLKEYLTKENHHVVSDNDGEIVVHMVEQYFNLHLEKHPDGQHLDAALRRQCMRQAIVDASREMEGSYAAVIVDPVTNIAWGIKSGSSFYAGIGDYSGNPFILVSSDLTSILHYTKNLIPIFEDEFMEFGHSEYQVYSLRDHSIKTKDGSKRQFRAGEKIDAPVSRSKLRIEDTALQKPFEYFMHQEIAAGSDVTYKLISFLEGGTSVNRSLVERVDEAGCRAWIEERAAALAGPVEWSEQCELFRAFASDERLQKLREAANARLPELKVDVFRPVFLKREFNSKHASLFLDLVEEVKDARNKYKMMFAAKLLDAVVEQREMAQFQEYAGRFADLVANAEKSGASVYAVSCGTSFNASNTAALFFNEIARAQLLSQLPGNFRGRTSAAIRPGDVLIGISQSGETKDLIDIFNDVTRRGIEVHKVTIVNNENSTLAQEKADFYLPIKCGPEIAVPATKSYVSQVTLFFYLAILVAEKKGLETARWRQALRSVPKLIEETVATTETEVEAMAEALFLEPSLHILATKMSSVAEEGALKIRETVLNHAQGFEASEFKHGPNTILGLNSVLGIGDGLAMLRTYSSMVAQTFALGEARGLSSAEIRGVTEAFPFFVSKRTAPFNLSEAASQVFEEVIEKYDPLSHLDKSYPLVYLSGPEERDIRLTISQINTHKIRGANTFVIAEENEDLRRNATDKPAGFEQYRSGYVTLPKTDSTLLASFSSMIVLQLLALKMSIKKMKYFDKLKVPLHGVHPDVPKNVSKSITVD